MVDDPTFPQFEVHKYPAKNADGSYLAENVFGSDWYELAYAAQGKMAHALLDLSPTPEGGNRFDVTKLKYVDSLPDGLRFIRGWDLAQSGKERSGSDYTASVKLAVKTDTTAFGKVYRVYIADVLCFREEAPRRNAIIRETALAELGVPQYVEAFGAGKDAYATLSGELRGISIVKPSRMPGDKSAKLAPLEAPFDAGNIYVLRSAVVQSKPLFEEQFSQFPFGKHDDIPDACAIAFSAAITGGTVGFII